jgi:hypothetical protein
MIIDANTYITPMGQGILAGELIRWMDKVGVDKAVTWLLSHI